jgi:hypothetical protein
MRLSEIVALVLMYGTCLKPEDRKESGIPLRLPVAPPAPPALTRLDTPSQPQDSFLWGSFLRS